MAEVKFKSGILRLHALSWILSRIARYINGAPGQIEQQYSMDTPMFDL